MATKPQQPAAKSAEFKVGDTLAIDGPGAYMCLPGGTVVTCRRDFTFRHAGEHTLTPFDADSSPRTITVGEDTRPSAA